MNDADSKTLEEVEAAVGLNYCFTTDNWSGKQARSPQQDERWFISKIKEQDREIEHYRTAYDFQQQAALKVSAELSACKERVKELEEFTEDVRQCADRPFLVEDANRLLYSQWTCPRCGAIHPLTEKHCPCEAEAQEQSKEVGG